MRTVSARAPLALLALLALLAPPPRPARGDGADATFAHAALAEVELGTPIQSDLAILIPLVRKKPVEPVDVVTQWAADGLVFEESTFPSRPYGVEARNAGPRPVLVHGGTVLVGGRRDRLLRHSVILAPGEGAELEALPAESADHARRDPVPFAMASSLAPVYLRRRADFGGSRGLVGTFVARNLEFRNPGDSRRSLAAIGASRRLQETSHKTRASLAATLAARPDEGVVVGGISAIRGRLQALTLYGTPELLRASASAYLLGETYSAAAIAIQAERHGIPRAGGTDPERTLEIVVRRARELLERLRQARFKSDPAHPNGAHGECLVIQLADGSRGHAIGHAGRLVHLTVYAHDPFESAYYGSSISLEDEGLRSDPERPGQAELERRAGQGGRLSEYEERLLRRLRGGGGLGVGPGAGGAGGAGRGLGGGLR